MPGWEPRLVLVGEHLYGPDLEAPIVGPITTYLQAHSRVYQIMRNSLRGALYAVRDISRSGKSHRPALDPEDFSEVVESVRRIQ